jgi:hypothetical protein
MGNFPDSGNCRTRRKRRLRYLVQVNGSDRPLRKYPSLWYRAAMRSPAMVREGVAYAKMKQATGELRESIAQCAWGYVKNSFDLAGKTS